jgi:hypothetical protein
VAQVLLPWGTGQRKKRKRKTHENNLNEDTSTGPQRPPQRERVRGREGVLPQSWPRLESSPSVRTNFAKSKENKNTGWRRKKQGESQAVVASAAAEARFQEAVAPVYTGLPARHTGHRNQDKPAAPAQTEPNTAPVARRTCWHGHIFLSGNALHRHVNPG